MAIGLIMEANPFHYGHQYLINTTKKMYPNEDIICITSTSFTMRGEISLLNKFDKVKILLDEGIDIVLELPIRQTLQSADYFSYKTVMTLNKFNVSKIIIGCEDDDLSKLDLFNKITDSLEFKNLFKSNLSLKLSYKATFNKTLSDLNIDNELINLFSSPNMTLALQYYRVIKNNDLNIKLILIKRTNNYYSTIDCGNSNIVSSSFIRNKYIKNDNINDFVPYNPNFIALGEAEKILGLLINFQLLESYPNNPFNQKNINSEGIENYVFKNTKYNDSFNVIVDALKNKRYSASRIRRFLLTSMLKLDLINDQIYLRVIGINNKGIKYINTLPNKIKDEIFSSPLELKNHPNHDIKKLLNEEIRSTLLYGILMNTQEFYLNEYKLPIRKEGK